jgi:large subunit ribosomal protein L10
MDRSKAVVLADYRGLTVSQTQELKRKVADSQAELTVAKNRLLKIALRQQKLTDGDELDKALTGPTMAIFCYQEEVEPLKKVFEFSKDTELPKFKVGWLGSQFLSAEQVNNLAQLPDKPVLHAKLVGSLASPIYGLVNVCQGNLRKLVYVLKAISEK